MTYDENAPPKGAEWPGQFAQLPEDDNGDRITLYYETFGSPDGTPLLLIQGLATQGLVWEQGLCENLVAKGFYVIRMDNRDIGLSTMLDRYGEPSFISALVRAGLPCCCLCRPTAKYSLDHMAADALALLDYLKIDRAVIMGASMGGMISQCVAKIAPQRVIALVLVMSTTGARGLPQMDKAVLNWMKKREKPPTDREGYFAFVQRVVRMLHGEVSRGTKIDDSDIERVFEAFLEGRKRQGDDARQRGWSRHMRAIICNGDRTPWLKKFTGTHFPTLVLHGEGDPLIPLEHGKALAAAIKNSRIVTYKNMGHSLPSEYWADYAEQIHAAHMDAKKLAGGHVAAAAGGDEATPLINEPMP